MSIGTNKMNEKKNRFGDLSTDEIQETMGQGRPRNNKKGHKVQDEII